MRMMITFSGETSMLRCSRSVRLNKYIICNDNWLALSVSGGDDACAPPIAAFDCAVNGMVRKQAIPTPNKVSKSHAH